MPPKSIPLLVLASERMGDTRGSAQVAAFLRVLRRIADTSPTPPADHMSRHSDKEAA